MLNTTSFEIQMWLINKCAVAAPYLLKEVVIFVSRGPRHKHDELLHIATRQ